MDTRSVDVFFDSLLDDPVLKKIVHLIAEGKDDEEIVGALLSLKAGGRR